MDRRAEQRTVGSTLDLMVLAMVQRGLPTSYELLTKAGLSVGATSRALKSLESDGLVKSTSGPRTSQKFELTQKGESYLKRGWSSMTNEPGPVTYDSALRFLYLAWLFCQPQLAVSYTQKAVQELRFRAKRYESEAEGIRDRFGHLWKPMSSKEEFPASEVGPVYRWLKMTTDAALFRTQADALEKAAAEIQKLVPATKLRVERPTQKKMF